jgi:hypothetical protein
MNRDSKLFLNWLFGRFGGRHAAAHEFVAHAAQIYATHDPCTKCGHGRFEHKATMIKDEVIRRADDALPSGQCRRDHFCAQEPRVRPGCECLKWEGVETPLPKDL